MHTIIERELFDRIKHGQFIILLMASIILFSASGLIFARRERVQAEEYARITTETPSAPEFLNVMPVFRYGFGMPKFDMRGGPKYPRPSTVATELYAPPCPLLFLAEGGDSRRPAGYIVRPGGMFESLPERPHNFKMPNLPLIDWTFIIAVVFSLYALFLGYNAISGEREDGTLRLTLANPMSRVQLLTAKYISLMALLCIPLAVGIFSSLLMLAFFFPHVLIVETAAYIALFTFSAVVFISIFAILSLLISALISQSSVVLLVLLTVWVLAVNFPHLAGIITERISEIPGERTIAQRLRTTREEYDSRLNENFFNGKSPAFQGGFRTKEIALEAAKPLMLEAQKALWEIKEEYRNAVQTRQRFTRLIANLSPVALFRSLAEQIAGSGMASEERFMHDVQAFSQTYDRYIKEKLGEVVVKTEDNIRTRYWIWYTKNDGAGSVSLPGPKEYEGNKADFPRFEPSKNTLTAVLNNSLLSLSGLFLWNLVLAGCAFLAINRADVR